MTLNAPPLPGAPSASQLSRTRNHTLAYRYPPAPRKVDPLTIDRIRDPPAAQQLKRHEDRSLMLNWQARAFYAASSGP
jgi:hypothetical protein